MTEKNRLIATDGPCAGRSASVGLHRFMNIELEAPDTVMAPRAETEVLGKRAIEILRTMPPGRIVVDMCCGSGNLALAIADGVPSARVWAADLTDHAVATARRNVRRLGLDDRVTVRQGNLFGAFAGERLEACVDLIVCNPPYISTSRLARDKAHLLRREPREAFDGGPYGIAIHQRLTREAGVFLKQGGWLMFEFGRGQETQVAALAARAKVYGPATFAHDALGRPRVMQIRKHVQGNVANEPARAANGETANPQP